MARLEVVPYIYYVPSAELRKVANQVFITLERVYSSFAAVTDYKGRLTETDEGRKRVQADLDRSAPVVAAALEILMQALRQDLQYLSSHGMDVVGQTEQLYADDPGGYDTGYQLQNRVDVFNSLAAILDRDPIGFGADMRFDVILQRLVLGQKIAESRAREVQRSAKYQKNVPAQAYGTSKEYTNDSIVVDRINVYLNKVPEKYDDKGISGFDR